MEAASGAELRRRTVSRTLTVTVTDKDGEVPGVPSDFRVAAATATTVTLAWTAPAENQGPVLSGYDIQYRTQGAAAGATGPTPTMTGRRRAPRVGGLAHGAVHELRIRALNEEAPANGRRRSSMRRRR